MHTPGAGKQETRGDGGVDRSLQTLQRRLWTGGIDPFSQETSVRRRGNALRLCQERFGQAKRDNVTPKGLSSTGSAFATPFPEGFKRWHGETRFIGVFGSAGSMMTEVFSTLERPVPAALHTTLPRPLHYLRPASAARPPPRRPGGAAARTCPSAAAAAT